MTAPAWARATGLLARLTTDLRPSLGLLTVQQQDRLASCWLAEAQRHRGTVAATGSFGLGLLATGAPAALQRLAARVHRDAMLHGALCAALAERYSGRSLLFTAEPTWPMTPSGDPGELAVAAFHDLAVGGTCDAAIATAAAHRCRERAVRRVLRRIATDATRRATLGWRYLRHWTRDAGRPDLFSMLPQRPAVAAGVASAPAQGAEWADWLAHAGQLLPAERLAIRAAARRLIVTPCLLAIARSLPASGGHTQPARRPGLTVTAAGRAHRARAPRATGG